MTIRIESINNNLNLLDQLRVLYSDEWGDDWGNVVYNSVINSNGINNIFVAIDDTYLAGAVAIVDNNIPIMPKNCITLSGLFIIPDYRNKGLAEKLINFALDKAKEFGINELWLMTELDINFYLKYGFNFIKNDTYKDHIYHIMMINLILLEESYVNKFRNKLKILSNKYFK